MRKSTRLEIASLDKVSWNAGRSLTSFDSRFQRCIERTSISPRSPKNKNPNAQIDGRSEGLSGRTKRTARMAAVTLGSVAGFRRTKILIARAARREKASDGISIACDYSISLRISAISFSLSCWSLGSRRAATRFSGFPLKKVLRRFLRAVRLAFFSLMTGL